MACTNDIMAIIEFIASEKEPKKLSEISKSLSISLSSTHRILFALEERQWLKRSNTTKKYSIGNQLLEIVFSVISRLDLRKISLPYLRELCGKVNETVCLSARIGLERIYIEVIYAEHELRQFVELGKPFPLWQGAPGKIILANMNDNEIEMVINQMKEAHLRSFGSGQRIKLNRFRKELLEAKMKGFAFSCGERVAGLSAVAAPIFDRHDSVMGAISVGGPTQRFSKETALLSAPLIVDAANKISVQFGNSAAQK